MIGALILPLVGTLSLAWYAEHNADRVISLQSQAQTNHLVSARLHGLINEFKNSPPTPTIFARWRGEVKQLKTSDIGLKANLSIDKLHFNSQTITSLNLALSRFTTQTKTTFATQQRQAQQRQNLALSLSLFCILLTIIIAGYLIFYLIHTFVHPLRNLALAAQRLEQNDLSARVSNSKNSGIGHLTDSFNLMAESLEASQEGNHLLLAQAREQASVNQALLDAAEESIWMIDAEGWVIIDNDSARTILKEIWSLEPQTREEFKEYYAIISDGLAMETALPTIDEMSAPKNRTLKRYTAPVTNANGQIIGRVFIISDITSEKESERLKDEFIGLVSHELRTPLTSILGFTSILLEEDVSPEESQHFLQTIDRNSNRLLRIVGDLLFVAQSDANRIILSLKPCPLKDVIENSLDSVRPLTENQEISFSQDFTDTDVEVLGDCERLVQLLDNLLSNAIKFSPPKSQIKIKLEKEPSWAVIKVSDQGMGISPIDQKNLFKRFFRTARASEKAIQGTGLGLAVCQAIVEGHKGEISVESQIDKGATFIVRLPLLKANLKEPREFE